MVPLRPLLSRWFCGLVLWFGFVVYFCGLVLWFGFVVWFCGLVLWFGFVVYFCFYSRNSLRIKSYDFSGGVMQE